MILMAEASAAITQQPFHSAAAPRPAHLPQHLGHTGHKRGCLAGASACQHQQGAVYGELSYSQLLGIEPREEGRRRRLPRRRCRRCLPGGSPGRIGRYIQPPEAVLKHSAAAEQAAKARFAGLASSDSSERTRGAVAAFQLTVQPSGSERVSHGGVQAKAAAGTLALHCLTRKLPPQFNVDRVIDYTGCSVERVTAWSPSAAIPPPLPSASSGHPVAAAAAAQSALSRPTAVAAQATY